MSALQTIQAKINRRSLLRGVLAAVPLAAIPAGAALAASVNTALTANDAVLAQMHARAMAAWQDWRDLPLERRERDQEPMDQACGVISRACAFMQELPGESAAAANMKIEVGVLKFEFSRGWDDATMIVYPGGTRELREQGEIELAALS